MSPKLFITVKENSTGTPKESILTVRNHLCFADDIVLTSDDLGEAKPMLYELQEAYSGVGLKMKFSFARSWMGSLWNTETPVISLLA